MRGRAPCPCPPRRGADAGARPRTISETISYEELLDVFWQAHDPTTPDRQGADVGKQYRAIILTADEKQKRIAEASRKRAQKDWRDPIVTEIRPLDVFWKVEDYHQNYYNNQTSETGMVMPRGE